MDRELLRIKNALFSYRRSIEDLTRGVHSKDSRWIEVAIKKLSSIQKVSRWIELAFETYRECDNKQRKGLDRQHSCREVSRLLKNSFSRREKHKYECNQVCYTTKYPNNILSSHNQFSTRSIVKHIDPKHTHTHTKQV